MTKIYDYVFVTHLPAFYKINLYNKIAERLLILVIFISDGSVIRTQDFVQTSNYQFDHIVLNHQPFEQRHKFKSSLTFIKILNQIQFKKIILGGWDLLEFWFAWGMVPKAKLAIAIESSIHESITTGPKSWLKKIFMSKINTAYVSGVFQEKLVEQLDFNKTKIITGGVGLINPPKTSESQTGGMNDFRGKFLYLGRLAQEKNIDILINVFSKKYSDYSLSLVGKGPLDNYIRAEIKNKKISNITLLGHVPSSEISQLFNHHQVLVLPSQQEPWGLVVEEAIAHGLPVIVSDKVGCHSDVIKHKVNGYIFKLSNNGESSLEELVKACSWVAENYSSLVANIKGNPEFDWKRREQKQVEAYFENITRS